MSKVQLFDTAAEFNIILTSSKRSDLLSELLSKLPVSFNKPPALSKIDIPDSADEDVLGAKVKTTALKPPSSHALAVYMFSVTHQMTSIWNMRK